MGEKSVEKRIRKWARGADPLPYWAHQRCADWWHAGRDARSGVPAQLAAPDGTGVLLSPAEMAPADHAPVTGQVAGGAVWATPRTVFLGQLGRGRAEREWVRYQAEIADFEVRLAQVRARRDVAVDRLADADRRLGQLRPPSPEELAVAAPGEEGAEAAVRSGRRSREFTATRQALDAEVRESRAAVEEAEVEVARLQEPVRIRRQVAEVRVAMIESYVRRRCSAYLTRLVRKHPDGDRIGSLVRSGWTEHPSWLRADAPAPVREA